MNAFLSAVLSLRLRLTFPSERSGMGTSCIARQVWCLSELCSSLVKESEPRNHRVKGLGIRQRILMSLERLLGRIFGDLRLEY